MQDSAIVSDTLQFVVILRKKSLTETSDKLKCVGHQFALRFMVGRSESDTPVIG